MKFLSTLFCLFLINFISAQNIINETIMHDGIERNYRLFIPASYDGSNSYPLVFNFHGFGSNNAEQEFYSDMNRVGEANDFFICYPNGIANSWNVGWDFGSEADDVGFTSALIDKLTQDYSVDAERIYSCGMSNGGFMSYRLACELNDKIAAIASVTGSMSPTLAMDCEPGRSFSILQFHGTDDATVPYDGMEDLNIGIDSLFNYWSIQNQCSSNIDTLDIEDINQNDGSTAQRISITNCDNNTEVILYKIDNGAHTWPGAFLTLGVTNQDVKASEVIWDFFKNKTLSNQTTSLDPIIIDNFSIYPNPSHGEIFIKSGLEIEKYEIITLMGESVKRGSMNKNLNYLDVSDLISGTYIILVESKNQTYSKKFSIIRR
ncbi:MAG: T9SS type A sorting domain-containing protein [Saprospiraceae bacterium]|nr:T9SS type A sorting domain-containing protein [Saprospiraceae bacterium]